MSKKALFKKTERVYMILTSLGLLLNGSGSLWSGLNEINHIFEFLSGIGCAMIFIGVIGIFRLRKNPNITKQQEIEESDERNIRIREKSAYSTFFITLLMLTVAVIVCVILGNIIACIIINIFMAVHVLSYLILLHFNNNKM
ncbi:MAG: DUF2178 domain-containing protein [Lachnospiraceae bacterium]|nr:DUF2178 domain-containing protein [Lachnospiraceae bacterium]